MASDVEICNMALARCGIQQTIASLTENNNTYARLCARFYPQVRRMLLQQYAWSFSERAIALTELGTDPTVGWARTYAYPTDVVRINRVATDERESTLDIPFRVVSLPTGRAILCDWENAVFWCNMDITDSGQFDPAFVDALAWRLAAELAPHVSRDSGFMERCLGLAEQAVARALAIHGREKNFGEYISSFQDCY